MGIIQSLFQDQTPERVIIFASSKLKVKEVTQAFKRMKLNVGEMHSDLEQSQREQIMREFKSGRINILIATDIVSRGIDIDDIRLVINYDVPHDSEDYVHRIGRTARANHDGCAITFVSEKEQTQFKAIENFLGRNIYKSRFPRNWEKRPNTTREVAPVVAITKVEAPENKAIIRGKRTVRASPMPIIEETPQKNRRKR